MIQFALPWLKWDRAVFAEAESRVSYRQYVTPKGRVLDYEEGYVSANDPLHDLVEVSLGRRVPAGTVAFNRIPPGGGIPPHTDYNRKAVINFPIRGDFAVTPTLFLDEHDHTINRVYYTDGVPIVIDVTRRHAIRNDAAVERVIFSVSIKESIETFVEEVSERQRRR